MWNDHWYIENAYEFRGFRIQLATSTFMSGVQKQLYLVGAKFCDGGIRLVSEGLSERFLRLVVDALLMGILAKEGCC